MELVDAVPKELFNMKYLMIGNFILPEQISFQLFKFYKENKLESLFFQQYCSYLGFVLLPDILVNREINIILKQFCYAYSLEEGQNKSLYSLMNKALRSGNASNIEKFLYLISVFNMSLENKEIRSYEGIVFRGTKIQKEFIDNQIIVGKSLTNLSFWSASKSRTIAEKFLKGKDKNILFIIKTKENNIDIDLEKISKFNEEEILFLPYSKCLIKRKEKTFFNNKEIYEVELEGLDKMHERKNIKSNHISPEEMNFVLNFS